MPLSLCAYRHGRIESSVQGKVLQEPVTKKQTDDLHEEESQNATLGSAIELT